MPCAFIFVAGVQPLKYVENPIEIFFIKANAIVTDRQPAQFPGASRTGLQRRIGNDLRRDLHHGRRLGAAELEGVANQILQQLPHLKRIRVNQRQRFHFDTALDQLNPSLQIGDDLTGDFRQINLGKRPGLGGDP